MGYVSPQSHRFSFKTKKKKKKKKEKRKQDKIARIALKQ